MKKTVILLLISVSIVAILFGYCYFESFWVEDKTIIITHKDIPEDISNTKIVFISDIHHGPFLKRTRVKNLVQRINRLHPDIILLGGDYIHRSPDYIIPCFEELKHLKAPLGVFGVLGNHDHSENADLTRESMKNAGIKLLDNHAVWIKNNDARIKIGGVGDYLQDRQDINPTIHDVRDKDFVILVSHNPDYTAEIKTTKIDWVFSGHTHGGQVTLFGLWAPLVPSRYNQKYRTGIITVENMKVIVSNGIGTITPPVRFFARPQIIRVIMKSSHD